MSRLSRENIGLLARNPRIITGQINRYGEKLNENLHERVSYPDGISVPDEDWDVLAIFDACRYDFFEDVISEFDVQGDPRRVTSRGEMTRHWLQRNFRGGTFHDTVYVTANPRSLFDLDETIFHDVIPLFEAEWDDELKTVHPDRVTERVQEAAEKYPRKRIIGHYVQPHAPYIDEVGKEITGVGYESYRDVETDGESRGVWTRARNGLDGVTLEKLRQAYENSLRIALDSALDLVGEVDGNVVFSSDHGELLGDRMWPIPVRGFEHPRHVKMRTLLEVPWFEFPAETRRDVVSESPVPVDDRSDVADGVVEDRLAALGYTEE